MHVRVFLSIVKFLGDDLLAVAVREKIYRARWDDADQRGPKTLE